MKRLLTLLLLLAAATAQAQKYGTYYYQRATLFETLGTDERSIVFLGNSITDGGEWHELFGNPHVVNRGISGDTTDGVYDRLDAVLAGRPAKILLMIGTNDFARGRSVDYVVENIGRIADRIHEQSPLTMLYVQSILPVTPHYGLFATHTDKGPQIAEANGRLRDMAAEKDFVYIDLHTPLTDPATGALNTAFTNDGLHLKGEGYMVWREVAAPFVKESRGSYLRRISNAQKR